MTLRRITGAAAALTIGLLGMLAAASPAQAQDGWLPVQPWLPLDTSGPAFTQTAAVNTHVVSPTTVHLEADADDPDSKGTSVETLDLNLAVQAQQEISFRYELRDGATCAGGAPRVFVEISGTFVNSWDQLQPSGQQCGTDGLVTFVATENGEIGAAGVVYDSGAGGAVRVSDLTVGGQAVLFGERCEFDADLLAAVEACVEPDPTPSPTPAEPTPTPTDGGGAGGSDVDSSDAAGKTLPVTGSTTPLIAGGALALLALGGGLYLVARKRRVTFTAG